MPMIAVNLSQKTYSELMDLVSRGAYSGPEQFLEIAAFNQLALERGLTPEELLKGIHRPAATELPKNAEPRVLQEAVRNEPALETPIKRGRQEPSKGASKSRPAIAKRSSPAEVTETELNATLARLSKEQCTGLVLPLCPGDSNSGNQHIWGQVNRLFPIKAICRWVSVAASEKGSWPDLHSLAEKLVADATTIGSALEQYDNKAGRSREEMLATGLPRKGNLQSGDRFFSQFVARVTRANHVHPGAVWQYGLACFVGEHVQLTEAGMTLARFHNPVLDESFGAASRTLSDEERVFFLRTVWSSVPSEKQDFGSVLHSIMQGNSKPESLLRSSRSEFPSSWSDLEFRTHIYGVLARLAELGVLIRQREGRNVRYEISSSALPVVSQFWNFMGVAK